MEKDYISNRFPLVRIEKLEQVSNLQTLSSGYWIKGRLLYAIEVGKPIFVERYVRNDEKVLGVMNTSVVQEITPVNSSTFNVLTKNSVYQVEFLNEEEHNTELVEGSDVLS